MQPDSNDIALDSSKLVDSPELADGPELIDSSDLIDGAEVFTLSETAVVIDASSDSANLGTQEKIWQLASAIRSAYLPVSPHTELPDTGLLDIVPGMYNLTLIFDPLFTPRPLKPQTGTDSTQLSPVTVWTKRLKQCWRDLDHQRTEPQQPATAKVIELPICYGGEYGPDLNAVAEHSGLSPEQVINAHCAVDYTVCFIGFQPGFAYLHGLNPLLSTPRKATPRQRVDAGSVAIGGSQTGIYPLASPGGWQIIGRYLPTDKHQALFDIQQNPASLLQAGDRLRFVRHD